MVRKRLIQLLVVLIMCCLAVGLVACNGDENKPGGEQTTSPTATVSPTIEPVTYTVTVVGGTIQAHSGGSATMEQGMQVTVVAGAPADGMRFAGWSDGSTIVSTSATYTFTLNANVTLTATYEEAPPVPNQYILKVVNGTIQGKTESEFSFADGTEVTVIADAPQSGKKFAGWSDGSGIVSENAVYTFTISANVTLTATYENLPPEPEVYTLTVIGGSIQGRTETEAEFESGTTVTVTADAPEEGKRFAGWSDGETVVSGDAVYTFELTGNITLTATYEDIPAVTYTLTVVKGTIQGQSGTAATLEEGTEVTVVSDAPQTGKQFAGWSDGSEIVSENSVYTFTLTKNLTLTAVYEDIPVRQSENVATAAEIARTSEYYNAMMADMTQFPVTFKIGDTAYSGFNSDFEIAGSEMVTEENSFVYKTTTDMRHKASGLVFTVQSVLYEKYAAYEWVIYITNPTENDSPVVSELKALDYNFEGENPVLYHTEGDFAQFLPEISELNGTLSFAPDNGRSTGGAFPYYRLEYGDGGAFLAIGWAGQWSAVFDNGADSAVTNVTAGQQTFNAYLKAGEIVRTPTISIINYDGRDNEDRTVNLWRRWYIDNIMARVQDGGDSEALFAPQIGAHTAPNVAEEVLATEENIMEVIQFLADNDIDLTFYWIDAGWYYNVGDEYIGSTKTSWQQVGTWIMDTERFPTKMKAISDLCAQYGIKTLLWFEPERIAVDLAGLAADERTINPEWIINSNFLDMGNPEAVEFISKHVISVMKEGGISLYREDFNIDPLPFWTAADEELGENRQGITENKHIQGHFQYWDSIREAFPESPIDACASGGLRLDLDTMRYAISLHRTDYGYSDNLANQCYSVEMYKWMPYFSAAIGEATADKYALRMALTPYMRIPTYWYSAPYDLDIIKDAIEEHHKIDDYFYADYYDLLGYSRSEEEWIAWEFFDESTESGYALAFRHKNAPASKNIKLRGLDPEKQYHVWFEDRGEHITASGRSLMEEGITVTLPAAETSDIIYISTEYEDRKLDAKITRTSMDGFYGASVEVEDGYSRFDIRFNMSLADTVFTDSQEKVQTLYDDALLTKIWVNNSTLKQIEGLAAEGVRLDYDVVNNILRVYVKQELVDFTEPVSVRLASSLETYAGTRMANETVYTYYPDVDAWGKGSVKPEPNVDLDFDPYPAAKQFDTIYDLSEENIKSIKTISPWGIYETGLSAWAYGTSDGSGSFGVFTVTDDPAVQYGLGKQAVCIDYDKMKYPGDYYFDFGMVGVEPGMIIKISFMAKADVANLDDIFFLLRNENNAEGGDLGNYVVKGRLVNGEWARFTLEFIANPSDKGINLAKIAASKRNENATGKVYIDNIEITAEVPQTAPEEGHQFEEAYEGEIAYMSPWEYKSSQGSVMTSWNYGVDSHSIFRVEDGAESGADGKVLIADLAGTKTLAKSEDSGYFIDYFFSGLDYNGTYYLNFKVKSENLVNAKLCAMVERNFGSIPEGMYGKTVSVAGDMYEIKTSGEWTDARIAFVAKPDSSGVCCLRLNVSTAVFKKYSGKIYFDGFTLEKSVLNPDEFGTIPEYVPYDLPEGFDKTFTSWAYSVSGVTKIFSYDSVTYDGTGRSVLADLSDVTSKSSINGHGYFLDYFMRNLEEGKKYTLSFMYKTEGFADAALDIHTEYNFGTTTDLNTGNKYYASDDWKLVKLDFNAGEAVKDMHCLRFAIYPNANETGAGKLWLDKITVTEYDASAEGSYAEDKQSGVPAMAPWALPEGYSGGFAYWQNGIDSTVTIESDYMEIMGGIGKSIKIDLNGTLPATVSYGGWYLDYYIADLEAGRDYKLSFYIKSSELALKEMTVEYELNYYPENNPGYTLETQFIREFPSDWTKVEVVFKGAPNSDSGLCALRLGIYPGTEAAASGILYLDQFAVEEYVKPVYEFAEDGQDSVPQRAPWEIAENYEGGIVFWANQVDSVPANVFTMDETEVMNGSGKSIKVNLNDTVKANNGDGGYFIDYYIPGLTAGKEYAFTYYMKSVDLSASQILMVNEPPYGQTAVFEAFSVTEYPADWTPVTVKFTAQPHGTSGLVAIRVGFFPWTDKAGSGVMYLDQFKVEECAAPVEPSEYFEDNQSEIAAKAPWDKTDGTSEIVYWVNQASVVDGVFTLDETEVMESGKSIKVDLTGTSVGDSNDGGYFIDYYMAGLVEGKEYVFTYYMKSAGLSLKNILMVHEPSYGLTAGFTPNEITEYPAEWTAVVTRFTAHPHETSGLYAIRIGFFPGTETAGSGVMYLDRFTVVEYVEPASEYIEDRQETITAAAPWEMAADFQGGFVNWDQGSNHPAVMDGETVKSAGNSIKIDFSDGTATSGNINLDLYLRGLTSGQEYSLAFWYKSTADFNLTRSFICEANYGATLVITNPNHGSEFWITDNPADWKRAELRFTAAPNENGLCAIRFGFYVVADTVAAGTFWMDEFLLEEYTAPVYEFTEDGQDAVNAANPWDVTAESSALISFANYVAEVPSTVFTVDETQVMGESGKSIKVDLTGTVAADNTDGGYFLVYYMDGLTEGKEYVMSFSMKSEDLSIQKIFIVNEPGYGNTTAFSAYEITEYPAEWTAVETRFTASPNEKGMCAIRIGFFPGTETAGSGVMYLDQFKVEEAPAA